MCASVYQLEKSRSPWLYQLKGMKETIKTVDYCFQEAKEQQGA